LTTGHLLDSINHLDRQRFNSCIIGCIKLALRCWQFGPHHYSDFSRSVLCTIA